MNRACDWISLFAWGLFIISFFMPAIEFGGTLPLPPSQSPLMRETGPVFEVLPGWQVAVITLIPFTFFVEPIAILAIFLWPAHLFMAVGPLSIRLFGLNSHWLGALFFGTAALAVFIVSCLANSTVLLVGFYCYVLSLLLMTTAGYLPIIRELCSE